MNASATPTVIEEFAVTVEQVQDYEFRVRFDKAQCQEWRMDESAPLGRDAGPSAARVLSAAIGNCLSASLLFCARKAKIELGQIRTEVRTQIVRNDRGRLRIGKVDVRIDPRTAEAHRQKALRCLDLFEDFCVVTESVRQGIDVEVSIEGFE